MFLLGWDYVKNEYFLYGGQYLFSSIEKSQGLHYWINGNTVHINQCKQKNAANNLPVNMNV